MKVMLIVVLVSLSLVAAGQPVSSEAPRQPVSSEAPRQPVSSEAPRQPVSSETPRQPVSSEAPRQPVSSEASRQPVSNKVTGQSVSNGERVRSQANEKAIQKQVRQLMKMKCRPVRQKVAVKELLSPHNDLLDQRFWPQVVVVRRCLDSCSYCGDEMGVESHRCLPAKTKRKRFLLVYYSANGKRLYGHFRTQEHRSCRCG